MEIMTESLAKQGNAEGNAVEDDGELRLGL